MRACVRRRYAKSLLTQNATESIILGEFKSMATIPTRAARGR